MKKKGDIEVIGLMSGTSLDGLDMAVCRFPEKMDGFTIISARTVSYSPDMKKRLESAVTMTSEDLLALDAELGRWMGEQVRNFIDETESQPDLVSSHGHTVFHQPHRGFTLQIGKAAHIYANVRIPVISDFRSLDVALGGEGAPLVPVGDELLFPEYSSCLNLGGIANISYRENGRRMAFDICACNMVMNMLAEREGREYDNEGSLAASGKLLPEIKEKLNNWEFIHQNPPKSLGFEQISSEIFPLLSKEYRTEDLLHTFIDHLTDQIAKIANRYPGSMLITGGGAHNTYLRTILSEKLSDTQIVYPDPLLVNYKEALIFAFLGALHSQGKVNVLSSVTGASMDHTAGIRIG